MKKNKKLSSRLGLAAIAAAALALVLCAFAVNARPLILTKNNGPESAAAAFFDALCAGDYDAAQAAVYNCAELGIENEPESPVGRLFFDALKKSYSWEPVGGCAVRGMDVAQTLRFTSLDVPALSERLREGIAAQLELRAERAENLSDIYDGDGQYLPEVVDAALVSAAKELLEAELPMRSGELTVALRRSGDRWQVVWSGELASALSGGAL